MTSAKFLCLGLVLLPLRVGQDPKVDEPTKAILPIVIGHRGASGERPEHTLQSYTLAVAQGADYIEPDLVSTKDGVLIARHENEIGGTTNVAERYPERRRLGSIDGDTVTGWWTEDFTLAELKTLRAKERLPGRNHSFDGQFEIATFDEVVDLALQLGRERGRPVGVYPETKHAGYFRRLKLPLEEKLVATLSRVGWSERAAPVFIQSFEPGSLRRLRALTKVRLVQLLSAQGSPPDSTGVTFAEMLTESGLRRIHRYADGIGVQKDLVVPASSDVQVAIPTDLVPAAHAIGLLVHVWTMRSDAPYLPPLWNADATAELRAFAAAGVDGVFTDFPATAVRTLRP
jgi:glycerophosphoryl diester phosphodiesterase